MPRTLRYFLALIPVLSAFAQRVPNEYLVELSSAPLLEQPAARTPNHAAAILSEQARFRSALVELGAEMVTSLEAVGNLVAVRVPDADVAALRSLPGVRKVYPVFLRQPHLDRASRSHRLPEAWNAVGGADNAGAGIKIAIIDTGIDPAHPALQAAPGAAPEGFPKFRRESDRDALTGKIIVARSYDDLYGSLQSTSSRDIVGHGTGVAMAAGGNTTRANFASISGAAPKAFLGAYRVFPYTSAGASDTVILRAIEDALADGMDVINLSLGSSISDTETDNLYNEVFRRAAEAGVVVVVSASNDGPEVTTIASPAYLPEAIAVGATVNDRVFGFQVRSGSDIFGAAPGNGPNASETLAGELADIRPLDGTGLACRPLEAGSLTGKIALVDRGSCFFEEKLTFLEAAGARAAIVVNNSAGALIAMSVGSARLPAMMIRQPDGASLRAALAGGAPPNVALTFDGVPVERDPRSVADFSGRGPSITRMMKPDLSAIGSNLYTATTATNREGELYDGSGYRLSQGTSFSAPVVAGAAAVLKQARPRLTGAQYRSLLINTAAEFRNANGEEIRPLEIGAGLLNLDAAIRSTLAVSPAAVSFGASDGTLNETRTLTLFNLSAEAEDLSIEVHPLEGPAPALGASSLTIPPGESRTIDLRMEGTALAPGVSQGIVRVNGRSTLRVPYWYATRSEIPQRLEILFTEPQRPQRGAPVDILFRMIDTTGVAIVNDGITVTPLSEGASVTSLVNRDKDSPGVYQATARLSNTPGQQRFAITFGSFRREFSINAF